jgi:hypothetical protein
MAGLAPTDATQVNNLIGNSLRNFATLKEAISHNQDWLITVDLTADPFNMAPEDSTLLKSAVAGLDGELDTIDMTFINRLIGLF